MCDMGIPSHEPSQAAVRRWGIVLAETEQQLQDLENMALLKADGRGWGVGGGDRGRFGYKLKGI